MEVSKKAGGQNSVGTPRGRGTGRPWKKGNKFAWKAGESGNPGGRPKKDMPAEIAYAIFQKDPEKIVEAFRKELLKGNPKVYAILAERGWGKSPQSIAIGGADGGPPKMEFIIRDVSK